MLEMVRKSTAHTFTDPVRGGLGHEGSQEAWHTVSVKKLEEKGLVNILLNRHSLLTLCGRRCWINTNVLRVQQCLDQVHQLQVNVCTKCSGHEPRILAQ